MHFENSKFQILLKNWQESVHDITHYSDLSKIVEKFVHLGSCAYCSNMKNEINPHY